MNRIYKIMTNSDATKCLDWADNNGVEYYIFAYADEIEAGMMEIWMAKWPEWINV